MACEMKNQSCWAEKMVPSWKRMGAIYAVFLKAVKFLKGTLVDLAGERVFASANAVAVFN